MALRSVPDTLRRVLDHRRDLERDLTPRRVVGRNSDGTVQLLGFDTECVARGPEGPYYDGQILELPAGPRFDVKGTSGVSVLSSSSVASLLAITAVEPRALVRDDCATVTITGRGFRAGTTVEFRRPGETEPNPDIEVGTVTVIDRGTLEVEVCAAVDATLLGGDYGPGGDIVVTSGGEAAVLDSYDVVPADVAPPEPGAAHAAALDWRGSEYVYWSRWWASDDGYSRMEIVRLPVGYTPPGAVEAGALVLVLHESATGGGGGGGA